MEVDDRKELWFWIQNVARQTTIIPLEKFKTLRSENDTAQAIMPLMDPTGYMKIADKIGPNRKALDAYIAFAEAVKEIVKELNATE